MSSTSNLALFANREGGIVSISVDTFVPNLYIGVVSYGNVKINVTGPFASFVAGIFYAGFDASTLNIIDDTTTSTSIVSTPSSIPNRISQQPLAVTSNPFGNPNIVCGYTCSTNTFQNGCNTADQIISYFQSRVPSPTSLILYETEYVAWANAVLPISSGGSCCSTFPSSNWFNLPSSTSFKT